MFFGAWPFPLRGAEGLIRGEFHISSGVLQIQFHKFFRKFHLSRLSWEKMPEEFSVARMCPESLQNSQILRILPKYGMSDDFLETLGYLELVGCNVFYECVVDGAR